MAKARKGVYGRNSFRGNDLAFRDRYFQPTKDGFALNPSIRGLVRFAHGNLLGDGFTSDKGVFDFIFCRNLLIYFDRPIQQIVLAKLGQLLAPAGVLFVGPAEQPLVMEQGFVSANIPMAFACRKPGAVAGANGRRRPPPGGPRPPARSFPWPVNGQTPPLPLAAAAPKLPAPAEAARPVPSGLEEARRLADAGRLPEAAALCNAHLRHSLDCAEAYYLLGLVREAGGDLSAMECYRKALYLQPDHYETLLQMAALAEKNGDSARARTLKRRAQRVKMKP